MTICAVCGEPEAAAPYTGLHKYGPTTHDFQPLRQGVGMNRREALTAMREHGDHTFYTPEFAHDLQSAFGMKHTTQTIRANTRDPKGLFSPDVGPNAPLDGYASHDLAEAVARFLGIDDRAWSHMMGRGSRERAALAAIDTFLTAAGE